MGGVSARGRWMLEAAGGVGLGGVGELWRALSPLREPNAANGSTLERRGALFCLCGPEGIRSALLTRASFQHYTLQKMRLRGFFSHGNGSI